jgi:pteridine reductase
MHASGANVAIHYRKSASDADALAVELNTSRPRSAATVQADCWTWRSCPAWCSSRCAASARWTCW